MKSTNRPLLLTLIFAGSLTFSLAASAQKAMPSDEQLLRTYNANREISLVGTVVKYESNAAVPPIGAHLTIQTGSGQTDVHVGNAKVLEAGHLELHPGDNVRIVRSEEHTSELQSRFDLVCRLLLEKKKKKKKYKQHKQNKKYN